MLQRSWLPLSPRRLLRRSLMIVGMTLAIDGGLAGSSLAQTAGQSRQPVATTTTNLAVVHVPLETVRLRSTTDKPVVITAVAADPNSPMIAAAGDDHVIRLINGDSMQVQQRLAGHRDLIRTLDFHPTTGTLVSAGNDGQVILWDAANRYEIRQTIRNAPALRCVCFSPAGDQIAAVGFDHRVFLIGDQQSERRYLNCDCRDLRVVAFRDDGKRLITAGRTGGLHLYDLTNGSLEGEHFTHRCRINDLAFAPGRDLALIAGDDGVLVTFDTQSRQVVDRIPVTHGKLFAVTVLNESLAAVAGSDNVIRVIDIDQGAVVRSLSGHQGSVATLVLSESHLFSGGFDATLRRWSIERLTGGGEQRIAESNLNDPRQSEQR